MMDLRQAVVLTLLLGLTDFLPVSSSEYYRIALALGLYLLLLKCDIALVEIAQGTPRVREACPGAPLALRTGD